MLISKNTNQAIRMSGLVALTLATACADEPASTPASGFDASVATSDSGVAAVPAADGGQCTTLFGITGVQCTPAGGGFGYRVCTNGVPMGNCMSAALEGGISSFLGEGGIASLVPEGGIGSILGEGGLSTILGEGGISSILGDASLSNLPEAGTLKCAAGFECSKDLGALFPGVSACVKPGATLPESCTTPMMACPAASGGGTCTNVIISNFCISPCN